MLLIVGSPGDERMDGRRSKGVAMVAGVDFVVMGEAWHYGEEEGSGEKKEKKQAQRIRY